MIGRHRVTWLSTTTQHVIVRDLILFSAASPLISEAARRLRVLSVSFHFYGLFSFWTLDVPPPAKNVLPRDAMQTQPQPSCGVCPCICPSVTYVDSVKTNKHIFKIFYHSSFSIPNVMATFRQGPLTGASNTGGVGTNRDHRRYSWLSIDDVLDLWIKQQVRQSTVQLTAQSATRQWSYIYHSLQHARPWQREEKRT